MYGEKNYIGAWHWTDWQTDNCHSAHFQKCSETVKQIFIRKEDNVCYLDSIWKYVYSVNPASQSFRDDPGALLRWRVINLETFRNLDKALAWGWWDHLILENKTLAQNQFKYHMPPYPRHRSFNVHITFHQKASFLFLLSQNRKRNHHFLRNPESRLTTLSRGKLFVFLPKIIDDVSSGWVSLDNRDVVKALTSPKFCAHTQLQREWARWDLEDKILMYEVHHHLRYSLVFLPQNPETRHLSCVRSTPHTLSCASGVYYFWEKKTRWGTKNHTKWVQEPRDSTFFLFGCNRWNIWKDVEV
jgi:hypothetical protein